MKISQEVREYANAKGIDEQEALQQGMEEKAKQFEEAGSELYVTEDEVKELMG